MSENRHTRVELYQMQALPLHSKIVMTEQRIRAWYEHWDGQVYVSFSGGKDSTVLVDIITKMGLDDIPLVFVDTGLEYPEIREFVKSYGDRVTWIKPKKNFKQVIMEYGYPFISKEVSGTICEAKSCLDRAIGGGEPRSTSKTIDITMPINYTRIKRELVPDQYRSFLESNNKKSQKLQLLMGNALNPITGERSQYNQDKWLFLLFSPYKISNRCCGVMKKTPAHSYARKTGRKPITAQMADESLLRTQQWLKNGCNGFAMKSPISNPMSFWTEQDVLLYIKKNNIPICSVYGDIVEDVDDGEVEGQLTLSDLEGFENCELFVAKRPALKTTGCNRTGCMFCGYGCHMKDDTRFVDLKRTHPKVYEYIFKPVSEGGLGYKEIIEWINKNGNLHIKY